MHAAIDAEIAQARLDGVDHPQNLPFLLSPDTPNRQGILLVHGFGSTPHEMRSLADFLLARNFTVLGVRLPGHGTSPEDLASRSAEEWLAACARGYQSLQQLTPEVSAVGLSTGCLLLIQLALQQRCERLVLLSPYLRLKHPLTALAGLLSPFIRYHVRPVAAHERPFYYERRPLRGIVQLNRLRKQVSRLLPRVSTPTLVLSSSGDQTIYPGTAEEFFARLGSQEKSFYAYGQEVPHVLTAAENPCQLDVFQRTTDFLSPQTEDR